LTDEPEFNVVEKVEGVVQQIIDDEKEYHQIV